MLILHKALAATACLVGVVAASVAPSGFWTGVAIGAILASSGWRVVKSYATVQRAAEPAAPKAVNVAASHAPRPAMTVPLPPEEPLPMHPAFATEKDVPGNTTFMGERLVQQDYPFLPNSSSCASSSRAPEHMFARPPLH